MACGAHGTAAAPLYAMFLRWAIQALACIWKRHPPQGEQDAWQGNDASVVARRTLAWAGLALFLGDAERPVLRRLLDNGDDRAAEIVVALHHGSATGFLPEFYAAVQPAVVAASCGFANRYGYPAQNLRAWCDAARVPLLYTGATAQCVLNGLRGATAAHLPNTRHAPEKSAPRQPPGIRGASGGIVEGQQKEQQEDNRRNNRRKNGKKSNHLVAQFYKNPHRANSPSPVSLYSGVSGGLKIYFLSQASTSCGCSFIKRRAFLSGSVPFPDSSP